MLLAPRPGFKYRHTVTKALVPDEGFEADPHDLDIARALACGDLEPVNPARKAVKAQPSE